MSCKCGDKCDCSHCECDIQHDDYQHQCCDGDCCPNNEDAIENDCETQDDDTLSDDDYESTDEDDEYSDEEDCELDNDNIELDDDTTSILHGRWIYDGSSSIDEMIEALEQEITLLKDLKEDGWVLHEKVVDDYAILVKQDETE